MFNVDYPGEVGVTPQLNGEIVQNTNDALFLFLFHADEGQTEKNERGRSEGRISEEGNRNVG